jgi:hypothetical protein
MLLKRGNEKMMQKKKGTGRRNINKEKLTCEGWKNNNSNSSLKTCAGENKKKLFFNIRYSSSPEG